MARNENWKNGKSALNFFLIFGTIVQLVLNNTINRRSRLQTFCSCQIVFCKLCPRARVTCFLSGGGDCRSPQLHRGGPHPQQVFHSRGHAQGAAGGSEQEASAATRTGAQHPQQPAAQGQPPRGRPQLRPQAGTPSPPFIAMLSITSIPSQPKR